MTDPPFSRSDLWDLYTDSEVSCYQPCCSWGQVLDASSVVSVPFPTN